MKVRRKKDGMIKKLTEWGLVFDDSENVGYLYYRFPDGSLTLATNEYEIVADVIALY